MGFFNDLYKRLAGTDREAVDDLKVLFADPEPNMLDGHKRLLRSQRPKWKGLYATSGTAALELLAAYNPVFLVTELGLKTLDGTELLSHAQKFFPETVRIVLSSESDPEAESILRATQSAHQFLVKPCKPETLLAKIEQACLLRRLLRNPALAKIIGGIPHLPSLPPLYYELLGALDSENASLEDIGNIIARDVSMTTRVLHLVNSAFFGLPRRVATPQEAAILLGINIIKSLVLYVKLFFTAPDSPIPGLSLDEIWAHSTLTASLAREITREMGGDRRQLEEAMLGGMLHDVGKLLILDQASYLRATQRRMEEEKLPFWQAEYREHEASHAEIGAYLLGIWGLPDVTVLTVACHHRPLQIPPEGFSPVTAVHVANALLETRAGRPTKVDSEYLGFLGLTDHMKEWETMADRVYERSQRR